MGERRAVGLALVVVLATVVGGAPAMAWGPGGHAVIALGVAQQQGVSLGNSYLVLQGVYGSSAPDFAWLAKEPLKSALGEATHGSPGYREPWDRAMTAAQAAFAWGWLSHNEVWGADHYAHLESPLVPGGAGYVEDRAALLAAAQGIDQATAHDMVEVAIDLLLDQEHPEYGLGPLLTRAASYRDILVPNLLVRSYDDVAGANWLTIRTLETGFRAWLAGYGQALALPRGADDAAFAAAMAAMYGLDLAKAGQCLGAAKAFCLDPAARYDSAIVATIALVSAGPWPAGP